MMQLRNELRPAIIATGALLACVTAVEIVQLILGRGFIDCGIRPRDVASLICIPASPFIHAHMPHYASNIAPLGIFSFLLAMQLGWRFLPVSLGIIAFGGGLTWLFGRSADHIGASGLIYGYFGFLVWGGIRSRRLAPTLIALAVGVIYGGLLWGIVPSMRSVVSWESHLFGLITGVVIAHLTSAPGRNHR